MRSRNWLSRSKFGRASATASLQPVATLNVLAVNAPVAEEKFVVRDTLTEDGRIGKITDVQGLVAIKPVMHGRWTAVCGKTLLKPGDWVRTDNRGANAATLKIVKDSQIILGPGSLVEIVSPTQGPRDDRRVRSFRFGRERHRSKSSAPATKRLPSRGHSSFVTRTRSWPASRKSPCGSKASKGRRMPSRSAL